MSTTRVVSTCSYFNSSFEVVIQGLIGDYNSTSSNKVSRSGGEGIRTSSSSRSSRSTRVSTKSTSSNYDDQEEQGVGVGVLDVDGQEEQAQKSDGLELLGGLSSMNFVPPPSLSIHLFELLRHSTNEANSYLIFNKLKEIQSIHSWNCCKLLWRGVSEPPSEKDWERFEYILSVVCQEDQQRKDSGSKLHKLNCLLLLQYMISFFEEDHTLCISREQRTMHLLFERATNPRTSIKLAMKYILKDTNFQQDRQLRTFVLQKLLNLITFYCLEYYAYDEKEAFKQLLKDNVEALCDDSQRVFLQSFLHQRVKVDLLESFLLATAHVPKEWQPLRQQPISVQKFVNLFYNLTPTRAAALDRHILYLAHLLQSFLAVEGADLDSNLRELQAHTTTFCSKMQQEQISAGSSTLLKMMEFAVMSF